MNGPIARIDQLTHQFNKQTVLNNISLSIPPGSIYGFLGPNGAGKTTTLRLLLGLIQQQSGKITVYNKQFARHRVELLRKIGSLIEQPSLYVHLNARENLEIFRLAYRCEKKRIEAVLKTVGLTEVGNKRVRSYSLGMKQRLAIAIALLPDPDLLILDEPSNGLDPNGIIEMRNLIKQLQQEQGKTVIVSSHLLGEIEKMVTDLAIIHQGKVLFEGNLTTLQELNAINSRIEIEVNDTQKALQLLSGISPVRVVNGKLVTGFESREQAALLNTLLVQHGIQVYGLHAMKGDLEQLFIQIITGKS